MGNQSTTKNETLTSETLMAQDVKRKKLGVAEVRKSYGPPKLQPEREDAEKITIEQEDAVLMAALACALGTHDRDSILTPLRHLGRILLSRATSL